MHGSNERAMLKYLAIFTMVMANAAMGQHQVTVKIAGLPETHRDEAIFITGNFNGWLPGEEPYRVHKQAGGFEIRLENIPAGLLEYKFTRGDWQKLECNAEGQLVGPGSVVVDRDTVLYARIEGWRDDFPESTASPQVHLLDDAFSMPQLNRSRRIWIYLPADYADSGKRYPVLYMHDGQDLFDEATSEGRTGPVEWAVDETLDQASKQVIVVAVDHHSDKRMRIVEYFHDANPDHPETEGRQYLEFIVHTLKPYVDAHFRTLPHKAHTYMAGASMGGLVTLNAGLLYPDVFGALGVFSPSIWLDHGHTEQRIQAMDDFSLIDRQRYFFYAGDNESRLKPDGSMVRMHEDVKRVTDLLARKSRTETALTIRPGGRHGAWHWRQTFPEFYDWLTNEPK